MKIYFKDKAELVQYVDGRLPSLEKGSVLTMTIIPGQFADYSVSIVTGTLSANTVETKEQNSSEPLTSISQRNTLAG